MHPLALPAVCLVCGGVLLFFWGLVGWDFGGFLLFILFYFFAPYSHKSELNY